MKPCPVCGSPDFSWSVEAEFEICNVCGIVLSPNRKPYVKDHVRIPTELPLFPPSPIVPLPYFDGPNSADVPTQMATFIERLDKAIGDIEKEIPYTCPMCPVNDADCAYGGLRGSTTCRENIKGKHNFL